MTEEQFIKTYKPIIENLSKNRFLTLLKITRLIIFKNNGVLDVYEAQSRYEKIKLKLASGKKIKDKDLYNADVEALKQSYGSEEDFYRLMIRRYDFILELFSVLNESTLDITDIDRIVEKANDYYEVFFKDRFEKIALESVKQQVKHLI